MKHSKPDAAGLRAEETGGRLLYVLGIVGLGALLVGLVLAKLFFTG